MSQSRVLSTKDELDRIGAILYAYLRLPFSPDSVPGSIVEHVLGHVRVAEVLKTYDFADVIDRNAGIGWQVKSRKSSTPVTWKRAKIENRNKLISASEGSERGLEDLGRAILDVCNKHLIASLDLYGLHRMGYVDLILHKDEVEYVECEIPQNSLTCLFDPSDFRWEWSKEKPKGRKEQLSALHGFHAETGERWWSWHGRGENQLHFVGERYWLSSIQSERIRFPLPDKSQRISIEKLLELLSKI